MKIYTVNCQITIPQNDMEGRCIRVLADDTRVYAIGRIFEEDWFNPSEEFK